jgi:hypothetical protein
MIIEDISFHENSKLIRLERYIIKTECITLKESKKLISLIEQQQYITEIEIKKTFKKLMDDLVKRWDNIINVATKKVVQARKDNKRAPFIKSLLVKIDNFRIKRQMEISELIKKYKKIIKDSIEKAAKNKKIIKLKSLNTKYPKGKYAIAGITAGAAGYAANKIYHNYITKAARMCAGKEGQDKQNCIKKYKEMAKKAG